MVKTIHIVEDSSTTWSRIRAVIDELGDIPIIMVTTEGAEEDRKRALAIGADAYLPEPIHTQELIRPVNTYRAA
jgi:DNA-binding response OmpR family regulator